MQVVTQRKIVFLWMLATRQMHHMVMHMVSTAFFIRPLRDILFRAHKKQLKEAETMH